MRVVRGGGVRGGEGEGKGSSGVGEGWQGVGGWVGVERTQKEGGGRG